MATTYLYRHIRKDTNQVFYIGIGSDTNGKYKRANSKYGRNIIWNNIVKKTNYEVEIMLEGLDRNFAKEKEKEFINLYGRIDIKTGTLCNFTNGGEGSNWFYKDIDDEMTDEQKVQHKLKIEQHKKRAKILGFKNKGRKHSEETKKAISKVTKGEKNPMYGKNHSEEAKGKISNARKKALAQYELDGTFVREYSCAADTVEYGFSASNVAKCCRRTMNKHRGYIFKYINN